MSLSGHVYALHAFQKKSRSGIKAPKAEIDLIIAGTVERAEVRAFDCALPFPGR